MLALPADPITMYLNRQHLDEPELEALLIAIDDAIDAGTDVTRALLEPCWRAVLCELAGHLTIAA